MRQSPVRKESERNNESNCRRANVNEHSEDSHDDKQRPAAASIITAPAPGHGRVDKDYHYRRANTCQGGNPRTALDRCSNARRAANPLATTGTQTREQESNTSVAPVTTRLLAARDSIQHLDHRSLGAVGRNGFHLSVFGQENADIRRPSRQCVHAGIAEVDERSLW